MKLHKDLPTQEILQNAVSEVLEIPRYKKRTKEIRAKMQKYDPMGTITEAIEELAIRH